MKRILSLLIAFCMILSMIPVDAVADADHAENAQSVYNSTKKGTHSADSESRDGIPATLMTGSDSSETPQVVIPSQTVKPGDTFTVPVLLLNNPGIISFKFGIRYDFEKLEYVEAKDEEDYRGAKGFIDNDKNPFYIMFNDIGGNGDIFGETAVHLTFRVKDDVTGTAQFEIIYDQDEVPFTQTNPDDLMADPLEVTFDPVGGSILIENSNPDPLTVTFDSDGGSKVPEQTIPYGETATEPTPHPTKEHYTFDGWLLAETPYDFDQPVVQNLTLVAKWIPDPLTVTFDSNGGNEVLEQTIPYGETATEPTPPPTKDNSTFNGWQLNGNPYDFDRPVVQDLTLVAKWISNPLTVTFDSDGGSEVLEQTIPYGGTAMEPAPPPTKEHYKFNGWLLDETPYDFNQPVVQDLTLVAKWIPDTLTVTFDSNGGSAVPEQKILYGETATEPAPPPTKENNTFYGWWLEGAPYDFDQPVVQDLTLVAKWIPDTLTVTFDSDGGSEVLEQTIPYGETATEPAPFPTKEHYTFDGWLLDETPYAFDQPVVQDLTLVAKWIPDTLTVTFDSNGGSEVPEQKILYGETATEPTPPPTKENNTFYGWLLDGVPFDFDIPVTRDLKLVANWKETVKHTVTFNTNGGSEIENQKVEDGKPAKKPGDPTKLNFKFAGWYKDAKLTEPFNFSTPIVDNITLNAKWEPCYVATAVYGSYDCPEVWTLRRFRDQKLAKTWYGRLFIRLYYAISPTVVVWFGKTDWFQNFWRSRLDRMVARLQEEGFASTPYKDMDW